MRDTVHLLADLGCAMLRHSALRECWELPALKIEAGMCLSHQSRPHVGALGALWVCVSE